MHVQFPPKPYRDNPHVALLLVAKPIVMDRVPIKLPTAKILARLEWLAKNNPSMFHIAVKAYGIPALVQKHEKKIVAEFFNPANLEKIGRRENRPDLVQQMTAMRDRPKSFSQREKLEMLQFISNQYCDAIGAPRTTVKLYNKPERPNEHGYYGPGGKTIYLNAASPNFVDFAKTLNTIVHEDTHCAQFFNPNIYGNPIISRIMRANFHAYQSAENGYQKYRGQLVEVGAFAAGNTAEQMVRNLPSTQVEMRAAIANSPITISNREALVTKIWILAGRSPAQPRRSPSNNSLRSPVSGFFRPDFP